MDAFSDIRENRYVYHRRWIRHVAAYPAGCGGPGVDDERGLYRRFLRGPIVAWEFRREDSDLRGLKTEEDMGRFCLCLGHDSPFFCNHALDRVILYAGKG